MKSRKYTKARRAEQQDETRERIVEATVKLHEALGPGRTSIKAIAETAGVQRLTVYRHFPDEASLFHACSSHFLARHPPPDPLTWAPHVAAAARTRAALVALFRYYRGTERMWTSVYRDIDQLETVRAVMAPYEAYLDGICDDLVAAWHTTGAVKKSLRATLRHALKFATWQSLKAEKLSDAKQAELVLAWLAGIQTANQ